MGIRTGEKVFIKEEFKHIVFAVVDYMKIGNEMWNVLGGKERVKDVETSRGIYSMDIWNEFDIEYNGVIIPGVKESYLESIIEMRDNKINLIINEAR